MPSVWQREGTEWRRRGPRPRCMRPLSGCAGVASGRVHTVSSSVWPVAVCVSVFCVCVPPRAYRGQRGRDGIRARGTRVLGGWCGGAAGPSLEEAWEVGCLDVGPERRIHNFPRCQNERTQNTHVRTGTGTGTGTGGLTRPTRQGRRKGLAEERGETRG
jgi:hypothetical protein